MSVLLVHESLHTYHTARQMLTVNAVRNVSILIRLTTDHTVCMHFYLNYPSL